MAHIVTCIYCKKKFDRDKIAFSQISARRYAHLECSKENVIQKTQEEIDLEELEIYIKELFHEDYVNARIRKQIKEYRAQYDYTYSGMLKTLKYWYEIKGNSTEKANGGIGIIPYIYKDASKYYYSLYMAQMANVDKDINSFKTLIRRVDIQSPRAILKQPKLFNMGDDEE